MTKWISRRPLHQHSVAYTRIAATVHLVRQVIAGLNASKALIEKLKTVPH